jgi:nucleoside-diphosphate-sugar epimerase
MPRIASEEAAASVAAQGVRICVVRLSVVHGDGDPQAAHFVPTLISIAREKGVSVYIGDGLNRWTAVHRLDAARLYRLTIEKGSAGARYHAVADEGIAFRDIAKVIGRRLNIPVVSKSPEEAAHHFGWFAHFAGVDGPASSTLTRESLGWHPAEPSLTADLEGGSYFEPPTDRIPPGF